MSTAQSERVAKVTADHVNDRIRERMRDIIEQHGEAGREELSRRIRELDREWDIERAIEANAATLLLTGLALGLLVHRRFLAIPGVVGTFLLQHALQGWCPPVPILRRLGIRTQTEIDRERYALKALRGDFERVERHGQAPGPKRAEEAWQAASL